MDIQQTYYSAAVLVSLTFIHQNMGCGPYVFVLGRVQRCDLSLQVCVALWKSGPQKALEALLYSKQFSAQASQRKSGDWDFSETTFSVY